MSDKRIAREVSKTLLGGTVAGLLAGEMSFQVSDGGLLGAIIGVFIITFIAFSIIESKFGSPTDDKEQEDSELYYEDVNYAS